MLGRESVVQDPWDVDEPAPANPSATLDLLERQADLLVTVATGGPEIKTVNGTYKKAPRHAAASSSLMRSSGPIPIQ